MSNIQTRVTSFVVSAEKLNVTREQLIVDIFAEVSKRKGLDAQWEYLMENVAKPIAKHYKCEAEYTRNGTIKFMSGEARHDTAYSAFRALVSQTSLVSGSGNTNKAQKTDPVASLVKQFNTLSKAEQKRFLASI
jgi:hypothetical protein